jgi:hypothetical protein
MLTCPSCHSRSLEPVVTASGRSLSVCSCGLVYEGADQHSLHVVLDGRRRAPRERGVREGVLGGLNRREAESDHSIEV